MTGGIPSQDHSVHSNPFFHKCLWKQSAHLGAWCYTPVATEMIRTPELFGWVNIFGNIYIKENTRKVKMTKYASICDLTLTRFLHHLLWVCFHFLQFNHMKTSQNLILKWKTITHACLVYRIMLLNI